MTWQNPSAWAGVLVVGMPILIHLFSRHQARVQPFPSLRFLDVSRLLPTRRTRLSDLLLLLVRISILVAAVAALAQPLWNTDARRRSLSNTVARAIVIDTSISMHRAVANAATAGETALQAARAGAQQLAADATTSTTILTSSPTRAVAGATAWLRTQSGRGEVAIVSDFQMGTVDSLDLLQVPAEFGIRLRKVNALAGDSSADVISPSRAPLGDAAMKVRATFERERTTAEWSSEAVPPAHDVRNGVSGVAQAGASDELHNMALLAGADDAAGAEAATRAVKAMGGHLGVPTSLAVSIVFPSYAERDALARNAMPLDSLWMVRAAARIRGDSTWLSAAGSTQLVGDSVQIAIGLPLARTLDGRVVAAAARGVVSGRDGLIVFTRIHAGSVAAAALIAATARALSVDAPIEELEPRTQSDAQLRAWERAPGDRTAALAHRGADTGDSDARWLWVVVLALLVLETFMRRVGSAARVPIGTADAT